MNPVYATIKQEQYKVELRSGAHTIVSDEPVDLGGGDSGFVPFDLLAASLASCTCATLKMYANNKKWDINRIDTKVIFERNKDLTVFEREITISADLNDEQKKRLFQIA